jgi:hypothetical protein
MFDDIVDQLRKTEQEIIGLKRDKEQAEHLVALIVSQLGEIKVDMLKIYSLDYQNIKFLPDENSMMIKVRYDTETE